MLTSNFVWVIPWKSAHQYLEDPQALWWWAELKDAKGKSGFVRKWVIYHSLWPFLVWEKDEKRSNLGVFLDNPSMKQGHFAVPMSKKVVFHAKLRTVAPQTRFNSLDMDSMSLYRIFCGFERSLLMSHLIMSGLRNLHVLLVSLVSWEEPKQSATGFTSPCSYDADTQCLGPHHSSSWWQRLCQCPVA